MKYHALYIDARDLSAKEPESAIGEAETLDTAFMQIEEYFQRAPSSAQHCEFAFVRDTETGEVTPYDWSAR